MLLQRDFSLSNKGARDIASGFANLLSLAIGLGFWQAKAEQDDENWWTSAKPVELHMAC